MPYQVIEPKKGVFQLKNIKTKNIINTKYKSKETAINAGLNFMKYRKEKGVVETKNNKTYILNKK